MAENKVNNPPTALQQAAQENKLHPVHSFLWQYSNQQHIRATCNKAGTVENSLKKSPEFRKLAEKHKDKELVIIRDGKALSSHFPCVLLKNKECLMVKFVKAKKHSRPPVVPVLQCKKTTCELVAFHVLSKGGKGIVKIMENPALQEMHEMTVYAIKGEKVKQALRRDGRFKKSLFKKNCALSHKSTGVKTELSTLVDDLDGEMFQIILLNKSNPPDSQQSSLEDFYGVTESQSDLENGNAQKTKPDLNGNTEPQEMPYSKIIEGLLSSKFTECVKKQKTPARKLSRVQNVLHVEFGQNAQMCREVKTMKKLIDLSSSVCQVRINGSPTASGFLLFSRYVLTNFHVIKDIYDKEKNQLGKKVSVHFSYESIDKPDKGFDVEELVCGCYRPDVSGGDWALLGLVAGESLPVGLLKHFGILPQSGGICIIGHPEGRVKHIDPCLIVLPPNRNMVVESHSSENRGHVQWVNSSFFETVKKSVEQNQNKALTYESCFYFGSSGSPVFDIDCNVVAVHTGGYVYPGKNGENHSVIEYGQPLLDILERVVIQLVEKRRLDVLKEYLSCDFNQQQTIMDGVKKLVESRNLSVFKGVLKEVGGLENVDEKVKLLFEFFLLKEEPVPMELDLVEEL